MLLIEAAGERIFYTGDFRTNGRKGGLVRALMFNPPSVIDVLVIDGTNLGTDKPTVSEIQIEERLARLLDAVRGGVFVYRSAQNADRNVLLFGAARQLFVDFYAAGVMDLVSSGTGMPGVKPSFSKMTRVVTGKQRAVRQLTNEQRRENRCFDWSV